MTHKIEYIIASGGNYTSDKNNPHGCDEPAAIRDSLIARGIPAKRIILDYQGTRTLNSIVKAKEVYNLDSLTLISQKYHNERAIRLADHYGLHAIGYNAAPSPILSSRIKNALREFAARVKLVFDLMFGEKLAFEKDVYPDIFYWVNEDIVDYPGNNTVSGHNERDTIVGNFTGNGIDTLFVKKVVDFEKDVTDEDRIKYYATSNNPAIPDMEMFGCIELQPKLVYEGDVDGNGRDEWGYLHTWMNSQWRQYRIFTLKDNKWVFLIYTTLLDNDESFRTSGVDIVEKGPSKGLVKLNYKIPYITKDELEKRGIVLKTIDEWCDYFYRDTLMVPTFTPISKDCW